MIKHRKKATFMLHGASWTGSEIGGSQKMGSRVSLVWSRYSPISLCDPRPVAAGSGHSVMEQEHATRYEGAREPG